MDSWLILPALRGHLCGDLQCTLERPLTIEKNGAPLELMHSSTLSSPRTRSFPPYPIEIMEKMVKTGLPLMTDSDTELTCYTIRATFLGGKIERWQYLYFLHFLQEEDLRAFMFQLDWAKRSLWRQQPEAQRTGKSVLQPESVDKTSVLLWEEHCHECAPPLCYQT